MGCMVTLRRTSNVERGTWNVERGTTKHKRRLHYSRLIEEIDVESARSRFMADSLCDD